MFDKYAICPRCDAHYRAPFGSLFHLHFEACPKCGEEKSHWPVRTLQWVSTSKLFSPKTWGTGRWEGPAEFPSR